MIIENGVLVLISQQDVIDGVLTIPASVKKVELKVSYDVYGDSEENTVLKQRFEDINDFIMETRTNAIKKLVIEEGVEEIAESSFSGISIEEVNIPSTLTKIGSSAFMNSNIKVLNFAENSNLTKISANAFVYCDIRELKVPKNIEVIDTSAFRENRQLKEVAFEEGSKLTTLGKKCFYNTDIKNINFPKSLKVFSDALDLSGLHKNGVVEFNEGLVEFVTYSKPDEKLKHIVLPSTVLNATVKINYAKKPQTTNDFVKLHVKDKEHDRFTFSVFNDEFINIKSTVPGFKTFEFPRVVNFLEAKTVSEYRLNKNAVVVYGKNVFDLGASNINPTLKQNAQQALDARKLDVYIAFCEALKQEHGGKLKHYPPYTDSFSVPINRVADYAKNRKLFNELYKFGHSQGFTRVRSQAYVKFAIHIGLLEQDAGAKNGAISLLRNHLFLIEDINDHLHYHELLEINKQPAEYSRKKFELVRSILESSFNEYHQSGPELAFRACLLFDELIELKRDLKPDDVKKYLVNNVYRNVNDQNKELAQLASMFNLGSDLFTELSEWYLEAKQNKVKNIFDTLAELSKDIKAKQINLSDSFVDEAVKGFSFEWLNKDNEKNAMLGYITNCCSVVGDLAEDLLVSSLLNKQVQNLVVKDNNNTIVGKSTAYFNINKGVLHFNNIEANANFIKKLGKSKSKNNSFLDAFLRGMYGMIEEYNKSVEGTDIQKISVATIGNDYTDLVEEISLRFGRAAQKYYTEVDFNGYKGLDDERFLIYKDGVLDKNVVKRTNIYNNKTLFDQEYYEEIALNYEDNEENENNDSYEQDLDINDDVFEQEEVELGK